MFRKCNVIYLFPLYISACLYVQIRKQFEPKDRSLNLLVLLLMHERLDFAKELNYSVFFGIYKLTLNLGVMSRLPGQNGTHRETNHEQFDTNASGFWLCSDERPSVVTESSPERRSTCTNQAKSGRAKGKKSEMGGVGLWLACCTSAEV